MCVGGGGERGVTMTKKNVIESSEGYHIQYEETPSERERYTYSYGGQEATTKIQKSKTQQIFNFSILLTFEYNKFTKLIAYITLPNL